MGVAESQIQSDSPGAADDNWQPNLAEPLPNSAAELRANRKAESPRKVIQVHFGSQHMIKPQYLAKTPKSDFKERSHGKRVDLAIIDSGKAVQYGDRKQHPEVTVEQNAPLPSHVDEHDQVPTVYARDDTSSIYSDDKNMDISRMQPLFIPSVKRPAPNCIDGNILGSYAEHSGQASASPHKSILVDEKRSRLLLRSKSLKEPHVQHSNPSEDRDTEETSWTPLSPYFSADVLSKKEKIMIGDRGWLEDTGEPKKKGRSSKKQGNFLENLKKKAKEMVSTTWLSGGIVF